MSQNSDSPYGPTFGGSKSGGGGAEKFLPSEPPQPHSGGTVPFGQKGQPEPKKKKGSGCFVTGCFTVIIFIVLLVAGVYLAVRQLTKGVLEYASDQPAVIEIVEVSPRQFETTETKLKNFLAQVESDSEAAPLELTTLDINAIIQEALFERAKLQRFPVAAHVQDGTVRIELSFPLSAIFQSDRYLNASAVLAPSLQGSTLHFNPRSVTVGGRSVPPEWLQEHSVQTRVELRESDSPEVRAAIQKVEKIEVVADRIVVTPKSPSS